MEDGDLIDDACGCDGSMKYVHKECIERWIRESGRDTCEVCNHPWNVEIKEEDMCAVVFLAHIFVGFTCVVGITLTMKRMFTFIPGLYFVYLAVNCTVHSMSYGSVCQHTFIIFACVCSVLYLSMCILFIFMVHEMRDVAVQGVFVALGLCFTLPVVYISKRCV